MVRAVPHLSAIAPTNGCDSPQSRFWIAIASANTSRPQPRSRLIGCRKRPKLERMPNDSSTMNAPQAIALTAARDNCWDTGLPSDPQPRASAIVGPKAAWVNATPCKAALLHRVACRHGFRASTASSIHL